MKKIFFIGAAVLLANISFGQEKSSPTATNTYVLTATDLLEPVNVTITPTTYKGKKCVQVIEGTSTKTGGHTIAIIKGSSFHNGIIEADIAGMPGKNAAADARGFVGIAFRITPNTMPFEAFYIRPTNGRADDQVRRNHSTQYLSYPGYDFARFRKEAPEKYESYADLIPGEWTHIWIEVKGDKAKLFVKHNDQPVLIVNDLKLGGDAKGSVGIWIGDGTEAYFSNVKVTHWAD